MEQREELISRVEENEGCKLFCEKYGIRAIRGMEIDVVYDERRVEVSDWENKKYEGYVRILHGYLDCC